MEDGCADAAGRSQSRAASTPSRSSSKKVESFIAAGNRRAEGKTDASRFALPLGIERLGGELPIGFLQEDFHAAFRLFQLLLAFARKRNPFFEDLHRVVE